MFPTSVLVRELFTASCGPCGEILHYLALLPYLLFASSKNCPVKASISFQLIHSLPLCVLPTDSAGIPSGCFPGVKRSDTTVIYSQQLSAVCNKRATIQVSQIFLFS